MESETTVAGDGRVESVFHRLPESERRAPYEHSLFNRIQRPDSLNDAQIAAELEPFVDQLHRGLAALTGAIGQAEETTAELRREPRTQKIAEAVAAPIERLRSLASNRLSETQTAVDAAKNRIRASVQRPRSEDQIAELRQDISLQEIRREFKEMSENTRAAAAMRAAQDGNLSLLWALDGAPVPMVKQEALREIQERVAVGLAPWRGELVAFREEVHRGAVELTAGAHSFINASLRRLENEHGLAARLIPMAQFISGDGEAVSVPEARSAAA